MTYTLETMSFSMKFTHTCQILQLANICISTPNNSNFNARRMQQQITPTKIQVIDFHMPWNTLQIFISCQVHSSQFLKMLMHYNQQKVKNISIKCQKNGYKKVCEYVQQLSYNYQQEEKKLKQLISIKVLMKYLQLSMSIFLICIINLQQSIMLKIIMAMIKILLLGHIDQEDIIGIVAIIVNLHPNNLLGCKNEGNLRYEFSNDKKTDEILALQSQIDQRIFLQNLQDLFPKNINFHLHLHYQKICYQRYSKILGRIIKSMQIEKYKTDEKKMAFQNQILEVHQCCDVQFIIYIFVLFLFLRNTLIDIFCVNKSYQNIMLDLIKKLYLG